MISFIKISGYDSARRVPSQAELISADRRLELLMGYHPLALMPPPKSTPQETGAGSSSVTPVPAKDGCTPVQPGWLNVVCASDGASFWATPDAPLARVLPEPEPDCCRRVCCMRRPGLPVRLWSLKCLIRS
jgi:hypothetical protein